jgi:mannose-1-phosphate guanylyltransferase
MAAQHVAITSQSIVTLGITPTFPSTGYGYIAQGESLSAELQSPQGIPAYKVDRFAEKPDREKAEEFIKAGNYSWNAGMFVFQANVAIEEMRKYAPEILEPLEAKGTAAYPELPKKSIDYALMEPTQKATVLPVTFAWDDLGDWGAIERLLKSDQPNVEVATHVGLDTAGSLLYSTQEDELIVTIGLDDMVIVRDGKVTLIAKKERTQEIKQVLKMIRENPNLEEYL